MSDYEVLVSIRTQEGHNLMEFDRTIANLVHQTYFRDITHELKQWFKEVNITEYTYASGLEESVDTQGDPCTAISGFIFFFNNEEDAVLFKMVWC